MNVNGGEITMFAVENKIALGVLSRSNSHGGLFDQKIANSTLYRIGFVSISPIGRS